VAQPDLLLDVLELARKEKALEGEGLRAFAQALGERARLVLEERVGRLEERVRMLEREAAWRREAMAGLEASVGSLERENAWRREAVAALERENAWRRETNAALEASGRSLEQENAWRRESGAVLEARAEGLRAEREQSDQAHARLLAHHREVLERVAAELSAVGSMPLLRARQARRRLLALAALLRPETPRP